MYLQDADTRPGPKPYTESLSQEFEWRGKKFLAANSTERIFEIIFCKKKIRQLG